MINSIEINYFRGIRKGALEGLSPLVVLVGPNGSGKSTILDALYIAASQNLEQAAREAVKRHRGVEHGGHWFAWRGNTAEPSVLTVASDEGTPRTREIQFNAQGGRSVSVPGEPRRALRRAIRPADDAKASPGVMSVFEVRLVEPRIFNGDTPLHRLYTDAVIQGRRDEVREIIAQLIPRAKDLEILTEDDKPIVHVVFEDHSVPVAVAGDGIYSLVRMSLELASRRSGVVLLEEPEVHQHPAAIRCAARAILAAVRRNIQVILTTHSLELIDSLIAEALKDDLDKLAIYRLQLDQGELTSRRIPGPEAAFLRTEIENDLR